MKVDVRHNRMEIIIFRKGQLEKREGESLQEYLLGHVKNYKYRYLDGADMALL